MYANKYTVDGKLYFEATLIAVEEGGDPNQKCNDANSLGQSIRGHDTTSSVLRKMNIM